MRRIGRKCSPVSCPAKAPTRERSLFAAGLGGQRANLQEQQGKRGHEFGGLLGDREVVGEHGRGDQRIEAGNAEVVGASQGHGREIRAASGE